MSFIISLIFFIEGCKHILILLYYQLQIQQILRKKQELLKQRSGKNKKLIKIPAQLRVSENQNYNFKRIMQSQSNKIMIGSYPYRGNVNICRLICQYLDVPYENIFFNPLTWKVYKEKQSDDWLFQQLPFLIDGTFVVTQAFPMCQYIVKKSGQLQLLGRNIDDALVVDNFMWGKDLIQNVLSLVVEHKNNPKKLMQQMHSSWIKTIRSQLLQYEKNAKPDQFYLGYITVIDFILHEIFQHYKSIFRKQVSLFPKLLAIREKVASIPKIKEFEKSQRTVHEICPLQFYKKWKLQTLRANSQNQA